MLYRLWTEDINRDGIAAIVAARFPGFSLVPAVGYWEGNKEFSLAVEISTPGDLACSEAITTRNAIRDIALGIKELNKQQAVMIQEIMSHSVLV